MVKELVRPKIPYPGPKVRYGPNAKKYKDRIKWVERLTELCHVPEDQLNDEWNNEFEKAQRNIKKEEWRPIVIKVTPFTFEVLTDFNNLLKFNSMNILIEFLHLSTHTFCNTNYDIKQETINRIKELHKKSSNRKSIKIDLTNYSRLTDTKNMLKLKTYDESILYLLIIYDELRKNKHFIEGNIELYDILKTHNSINE